MKTERVVILAADDVKKWPRHTIEIGGEKLLERTTRLLRERGVSDIRISIREGAGFGIPGTAEVVNPLTGNDLGCVYGLKDLAADLFIFGDVYFTEDAIDKILSLETNFYGRTKAGKVKHYGEMFAIRPDERLWSTLDRMWKEYAIDRTRRRLWSWDLYSEIQGKDFYKFRNTGNFTEISDRTEDFDKEEDVAEWRKRYESPISA